MASVNSEKARPEMVKFYTITQMAYVFGAAGHFILGLLFWWLAVVEMVWFNLRNQAFQQLHHEIAEAADYVRAILPAPIEEGHIRTAWRLTPSTSLGGDAFGYHWIDQDHFALYLIDVSGHGVGAALLSVSVVNALRMHSLPDTNFKYPRKVLAALNLALYPGPGGCRAA